jgi:dTDP-4-dehydrorhamnose reductase
MIVILGGSGYIGTAFRRCLEARGVEHRSISRRKCNYYDREVLDRLLSELRPQFLINTAGFTGRPNVDACELQKAECLLGNAVLPGVIREACERRQVAWGHLSSGCIYTGMAPKDTGFHEEDPPNFTFRQNNCSFYSGSKALGEEMLNGAESCFVWRLRIPFNHIPSERNYFSKLMRYDRLVDVRNSLSHLDECVEACIDCFVSEIPFGTYHVTNTGSMTTREIVALIEKSGVCRKDFRFFESEEQFLRMAAKTPRSQCVLDNSKARAVGLRLSDVADAVERALRSWSGGTYSGR